MVNTTIKNGYVSLKCAKMNDNSANWKSWQWQIANSVHTIDGLNRFLFSRQDWPNHIGQVEKIYPLRITPYYLSLINPNDPRDPIALQCIPDERELLNSGLGDVSEDPLNENKYMVAPGLIHRYPDRVLLLASHECAVRCRHCNRKRTWKRPEAVGGKKYIRAVCDYLERNPRIREVILSGGDPLMLPLEHLEEILWSIKKIPGIEVIRIGTRVPVTLPMRITKDLADLLKQYRPLWLNTHFNHPAEITAWAKEACEKLLFAGIPVSNQTVLLKDVNDDAEILRVLFTSLQTMMVRPYYLFHCDKVTGTDHFRTSIAKGIKIMEQLWCTIGGLCLPKYVVDLPGGGGKAPVTPSYLLDIDEKEAIFRTFEGKIVRYLSPSGSD